MIIRKSKTTKHIEESVPVQAIEPGVQVVEPTLPTEPTPTVETVAQTVQTNGTTTYNMKTLFKLSSSFFDSFQLTNLDHSSVPKLDPTYVFDENLTNQIVAYLLQPNSDCLYIAGDAGCGKTTHVLQIASRLGWSVEQATLSTVVLVPLAA